jgi:hypothetical protein
MKNVIGMRGGKELIADSWMTSYVIILTLNWNMEFHNDVIFLKRIKLMLFALSCLGS